MYVVRPLRIPHKYVYIFTCIVRHLEIFLQTLTLKMCALKLCTHSDIENV